MGFAERRAEGIWARRFGRQSIQRAGRERDIARPADDEAIEVDPQARSCTCQMPLGTWLVRPGSVVSSAPRIASTRGKRSSSWFVRARIKIIEILRLAGGC